MDRAEQEKLLAQATRDLQDAQRQVIYLQQVVDGLTGLLYPRTATGSITLHGELVAQATPLDIDIDGTGGLRARDAVLTVLKRNPNMGLTPRQVFSAIRDMGLINPDFSSGQAAYDTALRRLADEPDSMVVRDDPTGTYIFRPSEWVITGAKSASDLWEESVRQQMRSAELHNYTANGWPLTHDGGHT